MVRPQRQLKVTSQRASSGLPILGIDVNGVLADVDPVMMAEIKQFWGISCADDDLNSYDGLKRRVINAGNDPGRVSRWFREKVNDPAFILGLEPAPGAPEGWLYLKRLPLELRIVTGHATDLQTVLATEKWLQMHGFDARCDFTREKAGWCRQTRAKWFVEDSPTRCLEIDEAGTAVFVLSRPYNAQIDLKRVNSLLDVFYELKDDLERGDS